MRPEADEAFNGGGTRALGEADDTAAAKRRRTEIAADTAMPIDVTAALTDRIAVLEAAVTCGRARGAVQEMRIAELEAGNARLSIEIIELRKRPQLPVPAAALKQLVGALGLHEPDLRKLVRELACMPRYVAQCEADLPPNPKGVLGTFAVTVPTGTTTVAGDAFTRCEGLAQVTLPATVTLIAAGINGEDENDGAFLGCTSLAAITLLPSSNLAEIGFNAFQDCFSLAEITLPPSLAKIGPGAFNYCTSLTDIVLPPNLAEIGAHAFEGCGSLGEIALPPNLSTIEAYAFQGCTSLTEIVLPPPITCIGHGTFLGCSSLSEIALPPNLTEIKHYAFLRCTSLIAITLPPSLAEIGRCAFEGCTSLAEITVPAGPVNIWEAAFRDCPGTPQRPST